MNKFYMRGSLGLQKAMLRKSVTLLARSSMHCSSCGRTPLVGENMCIFTEAKGERAVCTLCINTHPDGTYGTVLRSERIRVNESSLRRLPA